MSRRIQVTFILDVDPEATKDEIDTIVYHAGLQLSEPTDDDGDDATFWTGDQSSDWFEIK